MGINNTIKSILKIVPAYIQNLLSPKKIHHLFSLAIGTLILSGAKT